MNILQSLFRFLLSFFKRAATPTTAVSSDPLDKALLHFSPQDPWTIRDACEGCLILGGTGSGKTSGSGSKIAKSLIREGFGGIVLTVKVDERALWEQYVKACGREDDLVIFSPEFPHRFNFMEYEQSFNSGRVGSDTGSISGNLVKLFSTVMEIGSRKNGKSETDYWQNTQKQLLRNAIDLLNLAELPVSVRSLYDLVVSAPQNVLEAGTYSEDSFCAQVLREAERVCADKPKRLNSFHLVAAYWLREFPALAEKTRSIIVSSFTSMADGFLRGDLFELFCTQTNIRPEDTWEKNKIILLDLPVKEYAEQGIQGQVLFKYIFQKAVERRNIQLYGKPVFLFADECQFFLHSYDPLFQSTSRSSRVCTVYLSQNLPGFYHAAGGHGSQDEIDSFLGNLNTRILHANGDNRTNQHAADLIGKTQQTKPSTTRNHNDKGQGKSSFSLSEIWDYQLHPIEFQLLKKGGTPNQGEVQAIVFQSGRKWKASGKNFIKVKFKQEGF